MPTFSFKKKWVAEGKTYVSRRCKKMNQQEARQCAEALWRAHMEEVRADAVRRAETEECRMRFGDVCMRYEMQTIGQVGPNGYPVYIALHGGG